MIGGRGTVPWMGVSRPGWGVLVLAAGVFALCSCCRGVSSVFLLPG